VFGVVLQVTPRIADLVRRLASEHDGEVVATARALQRALKSAGADLNDLATHLERSSSKSYRQPPPPPPPREPPLNLADAIFVDSKPVYWLKACVQIEVAHMDALNDWARGFIESIKTRQSLTPKQLACFQRIVNDIATRENFVGGSFWKGRQ
jgi:hypothetical protein